MAFQLCLGELYREGLNAHQSRFGDCLLLWVSSGGWPAALATSHVDHNEMGCSQCWLGDSHGDHLVQSFHNELIKKNLTAYNFTFKNCSPANFTSNKSNFTENECFERIKNFIENNKNISTVVASFRWVTTLPGIGYGNFAEIYSKTLDDNILQDRGKIVAKKLEDLVGTNIKLVIQTGQ